jgi:hypothetical protein
VLAIKPEGLIRAAVLSPGASNARATVCEPEERAANEKRVIPLVPRYIDTTVSRQIKLTNVSIWCAHIDDEKVRVE